MPDNHQIYFTHGDISIHNVLLKVHGEGEDDVEVTALLDWEQAGWRPEFWEAAKIVYGMDRKHEWSCLALEMVVPGTRKSFILKMSCCIYLTHHDNKLIATLASLPRLLITASQHRNPGHTTAPSFLILQTV